MTAHTPQTEGASPQNRKNNHENEMETKNSGRNRRFECEIGAKSQSRVEKMTVG